MVHKHYLKYLAYFILQSSLTLSSSAEEIKPFIVKLNGAIEFQTAFARNNGNSQQQYVSKNKKNIGFDSRSHIDIEIINTVKDLFEYGGKLGLETTGRNDRRVASQIFALSNYGKIEVGSDKSAYAKMKVTAYSIASGPGGAWDVFANLASDSSKLVYVTNFGNFLDAKTRTADRVEYSRKISYYTPQIKGMQFGVSYIPDSSNNGHSSYDDERSAKLAKPLKTEFIIKDGVSYSLSHEYKNDEVMIKSAIGGELGKIKAVEYNSKNYKFKNLNTYNIGSEITYGNYGIAASYSNYLKSLTSNQVDLLGRSTYLYAVTGRYKLDKFASSLTYFFGDYKKNKVDAITVALEYKIIKGLLPYVEGTYYTTNGRYLDNNNALSSIKSEKCKGAVLVFGTKLIF